MSNKEIQILELLNKNNNLSQRDLANKTQLSLGNINSTIKNLIDNNYLFVANEKNKTFYTLTDDGFKLIEDFLKQTKAKKLNLHTTNEKLVKQAVILAAGKVSEFDVPIGCLELDDLPIIERTINQLFLNGIENIILVAGYNSHHFNYLLKDKRIQIVISDKFKWTGTMYSLSLAAEYITDDFLLIENDLVLEERTINHLLENPNRDSILITNESGSGDEAFVEIKNGFLYKMGKDIHQFNRIDGEMIGLSKISLPLYHLMLEDFKNNLNPYLNYEYLMMDVGRTYSIGYVKIDDLVWAEIDNLSQYNEVLNLTFPRIKRKDLSFQVENLKTIISSCLDIEKNKIHAILPIGGMTNRNYKFSFNNENYVLRIPGYGTDEMISRSEESANSHIAYTKDFDTEILYSNEVSGIKISRFIENSETLNATTAKSEVNMILVADILKRLHNSDITFNNTFDVFNLIEKYETLLENYNGNNYDDYHLIKEYVMETKPLLDAMQITKVPCHNDTVPENFIKSGDNKIYLIDWEYSGMNDPIWDLAAHSLECDFSEDHEELFLKIYFENKIDKDIKIRLLINKILQDFLWSLWTNIKEAKGDNFGSYGIDRYNRAKSNLKILHSVL
ncbi:phosphotransferase [Clostridium grantii]|uniref:Thiamine kinase n=1 Tax=Clostridium grantii DSM 8605 TaxID=1121316 RepID=A0A1M5RLE2_9CLOT|nr:phosphotransferase [Clostridium grantii]SHH26643.1 Thiamine kinase [Clostridium grantii DSM 8605]